MLSSFCDCHSRPERKRLLTYGDFQFCQRQKCLKKKKMCSMDETDGSLENHKYPAKFPTHLKLTSSVLGQRYTFCMKCRHYDANL